MRHRIAWMLRVVREARFAALVAGVALAGFSSGSTWAATLPPTPTPAPTPTPTPSLPIQLSDIAAGTGGFEIIGAAPGDFLGVAVSAAGDVNGDGLADVIVGAYTADPNGIHSGQSYVIFGKTTGDPIQLPLTGLPATGFAIDGGRAFHLSGINVSAAGDLNGDGLADLMVGSRDADLLPYTSGRTYIVFGQAGGGTVQLSDLADGAGGFVIDGEAFEDRAGIALSQAGDVNGDGRGDLILGAPEADPNGLSSGRSYVVFGDRAENPIQLDKVAAGLGGFAIDGEAAGDVSGVSVSAAGDVNGDGLADLIVGATGAGAGGSSRGRSYVIFGKADGTLVQLSDIAAGTGGFAISGESGFDIAGITSAAGDVNGDGLGDLLVGAPYSDPSGTNSGRSYVVFGKTDTTHVKLTDITAGIGGFAIDGEFAGDIAGVRVSAAGDVNGDGLADVIVGAILGNSSYVVFGKTSGSRVRLSALGATGEGFAIRGGDFVYGAGRSVSGGGDINGDGIADLIVGVVGRPLSCCDDKSGRSYVIFGSQTPPESAVYNAFSRAGDGPGGNPVVPTVIGDSRVTIDWPDDDLGRGSFDFGSSTERVVLNRSNALVQNLEPIAEVAQVLWQVQTDRVGAGAAELTFKYLEQEIAAITLRSEFNLTIFAANNPDGPWTRLETTLDTARKTARVTVDLLKFNNFALVNAPIPPNAVRAWDEYR